MLPRFFPSLEWGYSSSAVCAVLPRGCTPFNWMNLYRERGTSLRKRRIKMNTPPPPPAQPPPPPPTTTTTATTNLNSRPHLSLAKLPDGSVSFSFPVGGANILVLVPKQLVGDGVVRHEHHPAVKNIGHRRALNGNVLCAHTLHGGTSFGTRVPAVQQIVLLLR